MRVLTLVAALTLAAGPAWSHAGGLDENGCHNNKAKGVYECHQGPLKDQTFKSRAEAEQKLASMHAKPGQQSSSMPAERKSAPESKKTTPGATQQQPQTNR